jgi:hypothetical protein
MCLVTVVVPLLKRLNFLLADGTPTQLYTRFRNPSERASAMLEALKAAYSDLYARSEYAHLLTKDKLRGLVVEVTGLEPDNQIVQATVGTVQALKAVGEINEATKTGVPQADHGSESVVPIAPPATFERSESWHKRQEQEVGMNLSYTINLNLPPSPDPEVFNAIFKALKEHLLGKS